MDSSVETTTSPSAAVPRPLLAGLHHVKFPVTDLARSRAWYERVFGLVVELEFHDTDGSVRGVAYRLPGCEAKVALREDPGVARGLAGFQPVSFAVTDRAALEAWADWLDGLEVEHAPVLEASVGWVLIVHDPDGIELHLYSWQEHGLTLTDPRAGRRVDTVEQRPNARQQRLPPQQPRRTGRHDRKEQAMEHPTATRFREQMAALARGDLAPFYEDTREDFANYNDIGAGPWRENHGRDAFFSFFEQFATYLEGTFRQDLLEVIGYDDHVLAVVHETASRQGHTFDNRAVYLLQIVDGKWASLRTMDMDYDNINGFWSAVGVPALDEPAAI